MRVNIYVSRAAFADTLGAMREWLDARHCPESRFETAAEGDMILLSIELHDAAMEAALRLAFDPLSAAA